MNTTRRLTKTPAYHVCGGGFFVNDEKVPINPRILKIGLAAAGIAGDDPCGPITEQDARRILHMERAWLLAGLTRELVRHTPGRAA